MKNTILLLVAFFSLAQSQEKHYTRYVNPFIGTDGHGHTYPGATVPFGMVQLSPDAGKRGWDWCSGYHFSDTAVIGFSHTHLSGTGCADLGDISLMPTTSWRSMNPDYRSPTSRKFQHAEPGYYRTRLLDHHILVELTSTTRAGFHRYTFPATDSARVIINLSYGQDDAVIESSLHIRDSVTIVGYRFSRGWAENQKIFFAAKFSVPFLRSLIDGRRKAHGSDSTAVSYTELRGVFFFPRLVRSQLLVKVGISPTGIEGALKNLEGEIPDWNFENVRRSAQGMWEKELSKIGIETKFKDRKETFYTALYHAMLAPVTSNDLDGTYRGADDQIHHAAFTNYTIFSLWDTYRAAHPLFTLIAPERVNDFVRSMLAFYNESGQLPIWSLMGNETGTMIGYHSVPVIVDAFLKGFRNYDTLAAFEAMKKAARSLDRGLAYYNPDIPQTLEQKEKELIDPHMTIVGSMNMSDVPNIRHFQSGYDRRQGDIGDLALAPSLNDDISRALIARARKEDSIQWHTAPVAVNQEDGNTVSFIWIAGLATSRKTEKFHFFIDNKRALDFGVITDTSKKNWSVSEGGITLSYRCMMFDQWKDTRGYMILTVPRSRVTQGVPLALKVVGNNDSSSQFYMTFTYPMEERTSLANAFGLVKNQNDTGQAIKVSITHLGPEARLHVHGDEVEAQERTLRFGVNSFFIPVKKVETEHRLSVVMQTDSLPPLTSTVLVEPQARLGYVPADKENESVSKTLEYAFDDWCIAQMAAALGNKNDVRSFTQRSLFYKNLYDSSTGFMRGKTLNGQWVEPFNPVYGTQRQPEYTEGNAWQYTWSVQHDPAGLAALMGGKERFAEKLDALFSMDVNLKGTGNPSDVTGLIGLYAHGNEPSHHIAYLYNYAGKPWKTQEKVRTILTTFYRNSPDGLIGNEDCGQMSAWYVFSSLGFYPVNPASGAYDLGTPLFDKAVIKLPAGGAFTIRAKNLSEKNVYTENVTMNGKAIDSLFVLHSDILKGGVLEFSMKRPGSRR